jgi:hypothetical protein
MNTFFSRINFVEWQDGTFLSIYSKEYLPESMLISLSSFILIIRYEWMLNELLELLRDPDYHFEIFPSNHPFGIPALNLFLLHVFLAHFRETLHGD